MIAQIIIEKLFHLVNLPHTCIFIMILGRQHIIFFFFIIEEEKNIINTWKQKRSFQFLFQNLSDSICIDIFSEIFADESYVIMDKITKTLCLVFSDYLWCGKILG